MISRAKIEAAASAIANSRGARMGAPAVTNVLEILKRAAPRIHAEVLEDATAALEAAEKVE